MIEVRDTNNNLRCEVPITDKCVYQKTLMAEEYVLLSFESSSLIDFAKGDTIKTDFGKFYLKDIEKPTRASDGGWQYEQKFVAKWELFRNRICFYNRQTGFEKSWKMTQTPEYFMDVVVRNIQLAGYGRYSYVVDASLTEMKLVEFDATNIIDALTKIADAWETEWWIDGTVIHIGKCEFGSPVTLTDGDEVTDLEREDSQDTAYCTRAYVFGSTRNLPKNYRKNDDGTVVVEGVVETRLKLPAGTPYIDAWNNLKDEDVVEGVIILDEVYPRKTGTIDTITTKQYTDEIENEDGSKTYQKWNAFRFTDTSIKFSKDYILADEELRIVFQTGKLAGMDFAVNFNPDGLAESEAGAQVFEIVRNEDYGVPLPTDDFKPSVGDTYILYGYDTKYVYDNLVSEAEQELLQKGKEKLADYSKDKSVYNCKANPVRCAGYKPNSTGNLIHAAEDEIDLDVGQAVLLKSSNIDGGSRSSRIRGFEKHLDNKYNCSYVIGIEAAYSRGNDLQEQVDELTYQSKQFVNVYGSSIYVVKRYDITAPSDNNVPSFRRAQYEFLQKHVADRATERIGFDKGIELGNFVTKEQGGNLDGKGNAELLSLIVRSFFGSQDFSSGLIGGRGWQAWMDAIGKSHMEVDALTVRDKATFAELEVRKATYTGGNVVYSSAGSRIVKAVPLDKDKNPLESESTSTSFLNTPDGTMYTRCYLYADDGSTRTENWWKVGDQAMCKTFNVKEGYYEGVANRYYWRLVCATGSEMLSDGKMYDYVDLYCGSATTIAITIEGVEKTLQGYDTSLANDLPKSEDTIVQVGSQTDTGRQSMIQMVVTGDEAPAMMMYNNINGYKLNLVQKYSPRGTEVKASYFHMVSNGDVNVSQPLYVPRGEYNADATYGYHDEVSYGGSLYVYISQTASTGHLPTDTEYWEKVVSAGTNGAYDMIEYALSAQSTTGSASTAPTIYGDWADTPSSPTASYPYLWEKIVHYDTEGKAGTPSYVMVTGPKGEQGDKGDKGDGYSISFKLNGVHVEVLNFDTIKALEGSEVTLEADFYNNGEPYNAANGTITCYDAEGNVLGSPIEVSNSESVVADGGNLYLSKDCKTITVVGKDESGNLLVSKSIGVVRNGKDATELISLILYLTSGAFTWRSGQGKIATLAAAVTKGNYDITDAQDASQFIWTRESSDSQGDTNWNSQHKFGSKTLEVSEGDMYGDITSFVCTLHKSTGEVYTMAKQDFTI